MICDKDAGGKCIRPCSSSSDCQEDPARPYCHRQTGICGECRDDSHCASDVAPRCSPEFPECVACLSNEDCQSLDAGDVCNTLDFSCVDCLQDSDCIYSETEQRCDIDHNACVECLASSDCPSERPNCNAEELRCEGCQNHNDCREDELCHPGLDECYPSCGDIINDRSATGMINSAVANTFVNTEGNTAASNLLANTDGFYAYSIEGESQAEAGLIGFPLNIPDDATLSGISVSVIASVQGDSEEDDWYLQIQTPGQQEEQEAIEQEKLGDTDTLYVFGGPDYTWGKNWEIQDVNSPTFGFVVRVVDKENLANARARVDHVWITVFFAQPGGTECALIEVEEALYCREDNVCDLAE